MLIGNTDSQARKLERYEQKLLENLKQTHLKQQEAILEIQEMVYQGNPQQLSRGATLSSDRMQQQDTMRSFRINESVQGQLNSKGEASTEKVSTHEVQEIASLGKLDQVVPKQTQPSMKQLPAHDSIYEAEGEGDSSFCQNMSNPPASDMKVKRRRSSLMEDSLL